MLLSDVLLLESVELNHSFLSLVNMIDTLVCMLCGRVSHILGNYRLINAFFSL